MDGCAWVTIKQSWHCARTQCPKTDLNGLHHLPPLVKLGVDNLAVLRSTERRLQGSHRKPEHRLLVCYENKTQLGKRREHIVTLTTLVVDTLLWQSMQEPVARQTKNKVQTSKPTFSCLFFSRSASRIRRFSSCSIFSLSSRSSLSFAAL